MTCALESCLLVRSFELGFEPEVEPLLDMEQPDSSGNLVSAAAALAYKYHFWGSNVEFGIIVGAAFNPPLPLTPYLMHLNLEMADIPTNRPRTGHATNKIRT